MRGSRINDSGVLLLGIECLRFVMRDDFDGNLSVAL